MIGRMLSMRGLLMRKRMGRMLLRQMLLMLLTFFALLLLKKGFFDGASIMADLEVGI